MTSSHNLFTQLLCARCFPSFITFRDSGSKNNTLPLKLEYSLSTNIDVLFSNKKNCKFVPLFFRQPLFKIGCPMHVDLN